ncbi:MAG TPA: type I-D CRISPR-associated protein Cas5/Csc1 [Aggregatilineales bacterium]|nr:type I-D CRISPR-associated protein Cas5/Csc1 [Aggregatilineales bacterium]
MLLYHCRLTFHENLYYETRTLGRLYETGRLLHNIALCYALGFAQTTYHHEDDIPRYAQELAVLNDANIYVTPASGEDVQYAIHTFKLGDERNAVFLERSNVNIPTYGRAKEVSVGSRFRFGVLCEQPPSFPGWLRMGLWMSKARLEVQEIPLQRISQQREETISAYPLNPADIPESAALRLFDLVSMRPSSLVENALIESEDWWSGRLPNDNPIYLPVGLRHQVTV